MAHDPVYDFATQERLGAIGQRIATMALLSDPDWIAVGGESDRREQLRLNVDQLMDYRGCRALVEFKTDLTALRTYRLAFETRHEGTHNKRGWIYTTAAAYVVALVCERDGIESFAGKSEINRAGMLMVLGTQALRAEFPAWARAHPEKTVKNPGFTTYFNPVPIPVVRRSSALVAEYGVAFRHWKGKAQVTAMRRPEGGGVLTVEHATL